MGKLGDFFRDFFGTGYNNIFQGKLNGKNVSETSYGKAIDSWLTGVTGSGLTPAEQATNEFAHNEAVQARDWMENFYNQYQSPQAMVRQYQEAGLNPGLMYGSGASTPSPASTSAPSGVSPSSSPMALLQIVPGLAKLKAEIENVHQDTLLKRDQARNARAQSMLSEIQAQTEGPLRELEVQLKQQGIDLNEIEKLYKPAQYEQALRQGEVDIEQSRIMCAKLLAEINQLRADTVLTWNKNKTESLVQALTAAQTVLAKQQSKLVSFQSMNEQYVAEFRQEHGFTPETSVWGLLPEWSGNLMDAIRAGKADRQKRRADRHSRQINNSIESGTD